MKGKLRTWTAIVCLGISSSGCATAVGGTSQTIQVGSSPDGAQCVFTRDGQTLGKVTTPGSITVRRDKSPISVLCTKDGREDARAILNSLTSRGYLYGPGLIGGVLAVSTLVDRASGADLHYQTALMVTLEALSAADQAAARDKNSAPPPGPAPSPVPAPPLASSAPASIGPFDGDYHGGLSRSGTLREIEVRIAGGGGVGTIRWAGCPNPGEAHLTINSSGVVSGTMDIIGRACSAQVGKVEGRAMGDFLKLQITIDDKVIEFSLSRQAKTG